MMVTRTAGAVACLVLAAVLACLGVVAPNGFPLMLASGALLLGAGALAEDRP